MTSMTHGCLYYIDPESGHVTNRVVTGGVANGLAEGSNRLLYVAQNGGKFPGPRIDGICGGVQIVDQLGRVSWLTQDPVSPNDLCIGPDGMIYLTDPTRNGRRDDGRLWRCDPKTGQAEILASVPWYPNGIGFSANDSLLVARTGERQIMRYEFLESGRLSTPEVFVEGLVGLPDGFAFASDGMLVVCCIGTNGDPGHLQVITNRGEIMDTLSPGASRSYTNLAIDRDGTLILTDADAGRVLSCVWTDPGLPLYPSRWNRAEHEDER